MEGTLHKFYSNIQAAYRRFWKEIILVMALVLGAMNISAYEHQPKWGTDLMSHSFAVQMNLPRHSVDHQRELLSSYLDEYYFYQLIRPYTLETLDFLLEDQSYMLA